jgi:hypothetical protein
LYINKVEDYVFIWDETGPFLACVIITLLNICIVIGMFIIHKAFWERKYNKLPKGGAKYIGAKYMNTDDNEEWWNK